MDRGGFLEWLTGGYRHELCCLPFYVLDCEVVIDTQGCDKQANLGNLFITLAIEAINTSLYPPPGFLRCSFYI